MDDEDRADRVNATITGDVSGQVAIGSNIVQTNAVVQDASSLEKMGAQPRVFVSYRRSDSDAYAGRLGDWLRQAFGSKNVFTDVDSILPGQDWVHAVEEAVGSCDALVAVIGPAWLTAANEHGRRLDEAEDPVRVEIESALKRGVPVIPVLVGGASMPRSEDLPGSLAALAHHNATELRHASFPQDSGRLIDAIRAHYGAERAPDTRRS